MGRARLSLSHRELKYNILPSEPLVDASKGVELVLCAVAFLGIQVDLRETDMREVRVSASHGRDRGIASESKTRQLNTHLTFADQLCLLALLTMM